MQPAREPWQGRLVDLRVDDNSNPLAAVQHYTKASQLAPDIAELPFWQAVTLFVSGQEDKALAIFKDVFARETAGPASGLLPEDPKKIQKILSVTPEKKP